MTHYRITLWCCWATLLASCVHTTSIPGIPTSSNACYIYQLDHFGFGHNMIGLSFYVTSYGQPGNKLYVNESEWSYKCSASGSWNTFFKGGMPSQLPSPTPNGPNVTALCLHVRYGEAADAFNALLVHRNLSSSAADGLQLLAKATQQLWQLSDDVSEQAMQQWAFYNRMRKPLAGIHIRAGDKANEDGPNSNWHNKPAWVGNLKTLASRNAMNPLESGMMMGDSWTAKLNATAVMHAEGVHTNLHIVGGKREAHYQHKFNKETEADRCDETRSMIMELDALARTDAFLGSMNSNIPRFVVLLRAHVYNKTVVTSSDASGFYKWHYDWNQTPVTVAV